jgi:hypothetical protein
MYKRPPQRGHHTAGSTTSVAFLIAASLYSVMAHDRYSPAGREFAGGSMDRGGGGGSEDPIGHLMERWERVRLGVGDRGDVTCERVRPAFLFKDRFHGGLV